MSDLLTVQLEDRIESRHRLRRRAEAAERAATEKAQVAFQSGQLRYLRKYAVRRAQRRWRFYVVQTD